MSGIFGLQMSGVSSVRGAVAALVRINNSRCAVEALLEEVSHRAKAGQAHPTGPHRTGAGHAVTLALLAHL